MFLIVLAILRVIRILRVQGLMHIAFDIGKPLDATLRTHRDVITNYMRLRYRGGYRLAVQNEELSLAQAIEHGMEHWEKGLDFLRFDKNGNR